MKTKRTCTRRMAGAADHGGRPRSQQQLQTEENRSSESNRAGNGRPFSVSAEAGEGGTAHTRCARKCRRVSRRGRWAVGSTDVNRRLRDRVSRSKPGARHHMCRHGPICEILCGVSAPHTPVIHRIVCCGCCIPPRHWASCWAENVGVCVTCCVDVQNWGT